MKNLLVTIGTSGNAQNTLQYAIDMAEVFSAKVYAIKVYDSTRIAGSLKNIDAVLEETATTEVNEIIAKVDRRDVEVAIISAKGNLIESIESISKELAIDLIVSSAKSISTDETLFLGKTSGSIVKDTSIPILIVPSQYRFKNISKVLVAVKSGIIESDNVLNPLINLVNKFRAKLDLIQVITPKSSEDEQKINNNLKALASSFTITENATVFQGILEHLHTTEPDMLCVMRRKRGFFARLWKDDAVKKVDFESRLPLLILKDK